ncbi:MAG: hypothetical protein AB4290_15350 [Spirulina sp.]
MFGATGFDDRAAGKGAVSLNRSDLTPSPAIFSTNPEDCVKTRPKYIIIV